MLLTESQNCVAFAITENNISGSDSEDENILGNNRVAYDGWGERLETHLLHCRTALATPSMHHFDRKQHDGKKTTLILL